MPGYPLPPHRLTPLGLLDKAAELGVGVVQFADNLPLERLPPGELNALAKHLCADETFRGWLKATLVGSGNSIAGQY